MNKRVAPHGFETAMIEHALDYARRGWPVFPCKPTDKKPLTRNGFKDATTDEKKIRDWWTKWPSAMIGVPMGSKAGAFAVDPDPPKEEGEPDGRAVWAKLIADHGPLPDTHAEVTPRGGQHILFAWDPNRPVTNSPGKLHGQNVDVRGEGGYIIVAPSICAGDDSGKHVAGTYSVTGNFFQFAPAPDWLYDLILPKPEQTKPKLDADVPEHLKNYKSRGIGIKPDDSKNFWREVSALALQKLDSWVPDIFGDAAKYAPGTGAYRVSSRALGRSNDEDLSLSPQGIKDWGTWDVGDPRQGRRTAVDVVIEHGKKKDATEAALWLCQRMGIDPAKLGWHGRTHEQQTHESKTDQGQTSQDAEAIYELFWHGKKYDRALRPWLVDKLIFETGAGLASGQWGAAKTFGVLDLSASVMTATPFAGRTITRQGGVVFVAAEGASEIPIRLAGVVEHKLRPEADRAIAAGAEPAANLDALPFTWLEDCPDLQDVNAFDKLVRTVKSAASVIREKFDLPLSLVVIDTLSAAGHFKDQDDAAEGQRVMNRLVELSRHTGAFVLAVDHFGKAVESGTRGTSAKEASADAVLAWLADRQLNGTISNTRMALRKLRGGQVGVETPFNLKVVDIGDGETTCIVEWHAPRTTAQGSTAAKERWPKSLRVFQSAISAALNDHGKLIRPFGEGELEVRAVPAIKVRQEFMKAYAADASDDENKEDAKRKAYSWALKQARGRELIGAREIEGIDHLWLVFPPEPLAF